MYTLYLCCFCMINLFYFYKSTHDKQNPKFDIEVMVNYESKNDNYAQAWVGHKLIYFELGSNDTAIAPPLSEKIN